MEYGGASRGSSTLWWRHYERRTKQVQKDKFSGGSTAFEAVISIVLKKLRETRQCK